jgi:hypothetical protein
MVFSKYLFKFIYFIRLSEIMNKSGYIIVSQPSIDLKLYESLDQVKRYQEFLLELREILNFLNPLNYRGTGRYFFDSFPYIAINGYGIETSTLMDLSSCDNLVARKQMAEFELLNNPADEEIYIYSLNEIIFVYDLLDDKENYEVIEFIENVPIVDEKTLGFDIGYFGRDYSIIADTAIKPMWHPPDFDDMEDIVEHLKKLNEHCLFPSFEEAKDFRELYMTKDWGEKVTIGDEFTIMQIKLIK